MLPTIYLISEWVIRLVMLVVVVARKRAPAALSWLAVIFFLPWVGLLLYALIGERRLGSRRAVRHAQAMRTIDRLTRLAIQRAAAVPARVRADRRDIVRLAQSLSDMPVCGGNSFELLESSDEFVRRLIADIDSATVSVHLLFYIFADDDSGRGVAEALLRARDRGVDCRLLADSVGSPSLFKRGLADRLRRAGVEVHAVLPVSPLRRRLHRIDLRNHRKLAVIDGTIGWTGSQNLVNADYGSSGVGPWRDLMIRLMGPVVLQLEIVFLEDWYFTTGRLHDGDLTSREPESVGALAAQAVPSGPTFDSDVFLDFMVGVIHDAEERIIITSPYFVPDPSIELALRIASMRGVQVDVVMPRTSNHSLLCAAARSHFTDLLKAGIRIHQHTNGLLHVKTVSIDDDLAIIGSGNFDMRSFYLNFELNMVLYGARSGGELRAIQQRYIAESTPLDLDNWARRSRFRKMLDNAAGLLSPLL